MVTTHLHTVEDLKAKATKDEDYELIEGELLPMVPTDFDHGDLQAEITALLRLHARMDGTGRVVAEVGFVLQRNPDTVLAPDVAFVRTERLPQKRTGFPELAPDLAVEIVSPGNTTAELARKIGIYLEAGVRAVWVVYPNERQVVVHRPEGPPQVFTDGDQIDGGEVMPELSLPVTEIFA
jgi:Uma2 family endonuclease